MATKTELIAKMSEKAGMSKKDSAKALEAFVESITDFLSQGEKVQLIGFGTFETRLRAAREGRNPQTGAKIQVEGRTIPAFKVGKVLKDAVK